MSNLSYVRRGDPLNIPADDYNAMVAAARANPSQRPKTGAGGNVDGVNAGVLIRVKNASGDLLASGSVVGLAGSLATVNETSGFTTIAVASEALGDTHVSEGRYAIAGEPINPSEIGWAYVDGACVAKVKVNDAAHRWASPETGETLLQSAPRGVYRLLWIESSESDERWAIVLRVATPEPWQVVRVQMDGGAPGSDGTPATFTYSIFHLDDTGLTEPIATAVQVQSRLIPVEMVAAANGTLAWAVNDGGTWKILTGSIAEGVAHGACTPPEEV